MCCMRPPCQNASLKLAQFFALSLTLLPFCTICVFVFTVPDGEPISINSAAQQNYAFTKTDYYNTDLVIIVTLHPVSSGGIAGYAFCAQLDQFSRCVVGYFNWVPDGISDSSSFFYPNVQMLERNTVVHEVGIFYSTQL